MKVTQKIRGKEYEIEIPLNQVMANSMVQRYVGYRIAAITEAYSTRIYKVSTSAYLPGETKLIGTLVYDNEKDQVTLYKFVDMEKHKFIKMESFGINNEVISRMRAKDRIFISNGKINFIISVRKALSVGKYIQFDRYEKQLFIPIEEFRQKEIKK